MPDTARFDISLDRLREAVREMTPRSVLFRLLKTELSARGWWRNKPRGNPAKGYAASQKARSRDHSE
jgi:hypothetical protein